MNITIKLAQRRLTALTNHIHTMNDYLIQFMSDMTSDAHYLLFQIIMSTARWSRAGGVLWSHRAPECLLLRRVSGECQERWSHHRQSQSPCQCEQHQSTS